MRKVFLAVFLLLMGCTGDVPEPLFGLPDEIAVVTLEQSEGEAGHHFKFVGADVRDGVAVAEVVLRIRAAGVSSAPIFIVLQDKADTTAGGTIALLKTANWVRVEQHKPTTHPILATHDAEI